jgi:hypothetical protein
VGTKTRADANHLPYKYDNSAEFLQVCLNKDLFDNMLPSVSSGDRSYGTTIPPVFAELFKDLGYDPTQRFSNNFLTNLRRLQDGRKGIDIWPSGLKSAKTLEDLLRVFVATVANLGLGDQDQTECGRTSTKVKVAYVFRHPKAKPQFRHSASKPYDRKATNPVSDRPAIETIVEQGFLFNREAVYREVKKMLGFWRGQAMKGPASKELQKKCGSCPFAEACPER